jgi:2-dehydro-3-deoxyphosphogalactonate aldolase
MNTSAPDAECLLRTQPIIAILRGLTPERALEVGTAIHAAGIRIVEVPLNSPDPFTSIGLLSEALGASCLCGAGTVVNVGDVQRVHDAGGRLIVAPNTDPAVIRAASALGLTVMPGIATATEAFAAIQAGATHLKLFPASTYGSRHLKALLAVLPGTCRVYPVGGIGAGDMAEWRQAGAAGFGFGTELFRPAYSSQEIAARAANLVATFHRQ